jgi:hypothetical protein
MMGKVMVQKESSKIAKEQEIVGQIVKQGTEAWVEE